MQSGHLPSRVLLPLPPWFVDDVACEDFVRDEVLEPWELDMMPCYELTSVLVYMQITTKTSLRTREDCFI